MTGIPPLSEPPRRIPAKSLWSTLAVPPVATVVGNLLCAAISKPQGGELLLMVPCVVALLIIVLSIPFLHAIRQRYRGASVVFLCLSYLIGETIICLALWFGTCVLLL